MKNSIRILLFVTLLLLPACTSIAEPQGAQITASPAAATKAGSPTETVFDNGRFSVTSTVVLEESIDSVDTQVGQVEMHTFLGEAGFTAYAISYSDYPGDFIQQSDPEAILDGSRDGAIRNANGSLVSEKDVSSGSFPGREFTANARSEDGQDLTLKARFYLADNRLYQVMVIAPKEQFNSGEADAFLESFQIHRP